MTARARKFRRISAALSTRSGGNSGPVQELVLLASILVAAAVAGLLLDRVWMLLAVGFAAYAAYHLFQLVRLCCELDRESLARWPHPIGLWGRLYDSSHRIRTGSARRKRRLARFLSRFATAASALPDGVAIVDPEGRLQWANPAVDSLLGIRWPQHAGQRFARLVDDPLLTAHLESDRFSTPLVISSPVDQTKLLSLDIRSLGNDARRLLVARDVTREYYLDRSRRDFVANASHELRTPLTVLQGALDALQTGESDDAQRVRSVQLIERQAARLRSIVDDLLTLSRLDKAVENTANQATVDVPGLLESLIDDARVLSGEGDHELRSRLEQDLWIRGDASELGSAFSNLIFNAVRHTPPRTRIDVLWSRQGAEALFCVTDTGEGIPARHLPRLTERFYRVAGNRHSRAGGTGLGLAIVKHALARHDAMLDISSEIGEGSRFSCRFPASRVISRDDTRE